MVAKARDRTQACTAKESRGQAKKTEKIAEGKEGCVRLLSLKMGKGRQKGRLRVSAPLELGKRRPEVGMWALLAALGSERCSLSTESTL